MPNAPWQDAVQPFRAEGLHAAGRMRARVSLTSLIDVVFILLVFFMLVSNFLDWRSLDLTVSAPGTAARGEDSALHIVLHAADDWRIGGRAIAPGALSAFIARHLATHPGASILIEPRNGVALQAAIDALDQARQAGATNAALVEAGRGS